MNQTDWLLKKKAEDLARSIELYWGTAGKRVDAYVVPMGVVMGHEAFAVRSNMINGLPERGA